MGVIAVCLTGLVLYAILWTSPSGFHVGWWRRISFFFLPAIMLAEAFIYWIVRKRNTLRRDTWNHVLIFGLAYATVIVKMLLIAYLAINYRKEQALSIMRIVNLAQTCIFWGLIIVAHIFFVRLLMRASLEKPAAQQTTPSENVLDDI